MHAPKSTRLMDGKGQNIHGKKQRSHATKHNAEPGPLAQPPLRTSAAASPPPQEHHEQHHHPQGAQHTAQSPPPPTLITSRLCIKNVPKDMTVPKLREHFAAKGEVTDAKILKTR
eukprot:1157681-Pelagomonas_calceolata.AAC.1